MFNKHKIIKDECMLTGCFKKKGYDWWWHSFTARDAETNEEKPFFLEFFVVNPGKAKDRPTFGQLGETPSYLMVKIGTWGKNKTQVHNFYPWKDVKLRGKAPFSVEANGCYLDEYSTYGHAKVTEEEAKAHPEYMCGAGEFEWNLKIQKDIAWNVGYGTSRLFRFLKAFEMYWHAEGMKTFYEGYVIYNGRKYIVSKENCYGYADKNWGRNFTTPWVWLSSNNLYSNVHNKKLENSVFDVGGGKPKVYFVSIPRQLLGGFYHEGKEFEFNFSKFWTLPRTKFDCDITDTEVIWHVVQWTPRKKWDVNIRCKKEDMLLVNYESPDGLKRHNNLWNGGNGVGNIKLYQKRKGKWELYDDIDAYNIGCEYGEYDK